MAYTAKDPRPPTVFSVPNRNVLYLRETKLWRCERGGRGETCHLLTHAAPLAGVGKNNTGHASPTTNPLDTYHDYLGPAELTFSFQKINMSQLRNTLTSMKTTASSSDDDISIWAIKQARQYLEPILLHLVNSIIITGDYPSTIKTTKIVPIEKPMKPTTNQEGWRPINIVSSISKIVERVLLGQILEHLSRNKLVSHIHHGAVAGKSTQTLVSEIYDQLLENLNSEEDCVLVLLDQSKAFNLVNHEILLKKLQALGFNNKAQTLMKNYLSDRTQYVQIQGFQSEKLAVGPQSVMQGNTLSCTLYLVYILDSQMAFHGRRHPPIDQRQCPKTNNKTFVNDNQLIVKKNGKPTLEDAVLDTMEKVAIYTTANRLKLNEDKTKVLVISKDKNIRQNFQIQLGNKMLKYQSTVKVGNIKSNQSYYPAYTTELEHFPIWPPILTLSSKYYTQQQSIDQNFSLELKHGEGFPKPLCPKYKEPKTELQKLHWVSNTTNLQIPRDKTF